VTVRFFLLKELVKRDFQSRYAGSLLGFLWPLVQPLWQLALFTYVFSMVLRIPLGDEEGTKNFAIFLFCGLVPWMAVHEGIVRSATAITDNAQLVKKVSFPAQVLVLAVVLGGLIQSAIAGGVFAAYLLATGQGQAGGLPLLLLAVPLQVALTLGCGLILCCLHTLFRDTAQVVSLVMTAWFYLTPIVYPLSQVPEGFRSWVGWNPLTTVVSLYRQAFLGGETTWVDGTGRLALVALLLLVAGSGLFRRLAPGFADEI